MKWSDGLFCDLQPNQSLQPTYLGLSSCIWTAGQYVVVWTSGDQYQATRWYLMLETAKHLAISDVISFRLFKAVVFSGIWNRFFANQTN